MDIKSNFYGIDLMFRTPPLEIEIATVEKVESELGFKFPQILKDYYVSHNGAQLANFNSCIAMEDSYIKVGDISVLEAKERGMDFVQMYQIGLTEFWPENLIPFAYDEGAHEFCFSVGPSDYGAIYFHMSELTGESEEVQFIADDFLSFLKSLRSEADFE